MVLHQIQFEAGTSGRELQTKKGAGYSPEQHANRNNSRDCPVRNIRDGAGKYISAEEYSNPNSIAVALTEVLESNEECETHQQGYYRANSQASPMALNKDSKNDESAECAHNKIDNALTVPVLGLTWATILDLSCDQ